MFILTGHGGFVPDNRSWTYGSIVSWLLRVTAWLPSVSLVQIVFSAAAYSALALAVRRAANAPFPAYMGLILVGLCEPLGAYWSRSIMSDSPAQSTFVLLSAALLWPGRPLWRLVTVTSLAFVLIGFRVVYFPGVALAAVVAVVWQLSTVHRARRDGSVSFHVFKDRRLVGWTMVLTGILLGNLGYAAANTVATRGHTFSTNVGDMAFLVGALSPLMSDELQLTPLTAKERAELMPLTYTNRVGNTFGRQGLVPLVRGHFSSDEEARPVMRDLVVNTIRRHPLRVAELAIRQWIDYLNPALVLRNQHAGVLSGAVPAFPDDARVILPNSVIGVLQDWNVKPPPTAGLPTRPSPALSYLEIASGVWSLLLVYYATFSLVMPFAVPKPERTVFLIFINSFAFLYVATIAVGANQLVTRYLLPLDVPLLYTVAVLVNNGRHRRGTSANLATAHRPH